MKHSVLFLAFIIFWNNYCSHAESTQCLVFAKNDFDHLLARSLDLSQARSTQPLEQTALTYYQSFLKKSLTPAVVMPIRSYYWLVLHDAINDDQLPLFELLLFKPLATMQKQCSERFLSQEQESHYKKINLRAFHDTCNPQKSLKRTDWDKKSFQDLRATITKVLARSPAYQDYLQIINHIPEKQTPRVPSLLAQTIDKHKSSFLQLLLGAGAEVLLSNEGGMVPLVQAIYNFILFENYSATKNLSQIIKDLLACMRLPLNLEGTFRPLLLQPTKIVKDTKLNKQLWSTLECKSLATMVANKPQSNIFCLLDNGANPNYYSEAMRYINSDTFLIKAIKRNIACIVRTLLTFGAEPNMIGYSELTPLQIAISNNNFRLICMLLYYQAQVNKAAQNTYPPLALSCSSTPAYITKLLLCFGADVHQKGPLGLPALYNAIKGDNLEAAEYLLEGGSSINIQDKVTGNTTLHLIALVYDGLEFLSKATFLLMHGANGSILDVANNLPSDLAKRGNKLQIVHYLEKALSLQYEMWCKKWQSADGLVAALHPRCGAKSPANSLLVLPIQRILWYLCMYYLNNPNCVVPLTPEQLTTLKKEYFS